MTATDYAALAKDFEACDLEPGAFAHADHVGVAYEMLRAHDFLEASVRYSRCIDAIATRAGAPRKFNTTITLAFLSLIAERIEASEHSGYAEFIARNPDLLESGVLGRWYSPERLRSDLARTVFLMPDTYAG